MLNRLSGLLVLIAAVTVTSSAQEPSMADILDGKVVPVAYKPADLPDGFKPLRIKTSGGGGGGIMDMMSTLLSPLTMMMGGSETKDPAGLVLMSIADLSWSKGDILTVGQKAFMVTYKWNLDTNEIALGSTGKTGAESKADTLKNMKLTLTLVALDSVSMLTAVTDFDKAKLVSTLEQLASSAPPVEKSTTADDPTLSEGDAKETAGLSNARQISTALLMYASDCDDVAPYAQSTKAVQFVTYPYLKSFEAWSTHNPNGSQFRFNMSLAGVSLLSASEPNAIVLFYEDKVWPNGKRIVAFLDGHSAMLTPEEWKQVEPSLKLTYLKVGKPLPLDYGQNWKPGG